MFIHPSIHPAADFLLHLIIIMAARGLCHYHKHMSFWGTDMTHAVVVLLGRTVSFHQI